MRRPLAEAERIERQAAAWLGRCDGGLGAEARAEFERWLAADPRHAEAVAEIEAAWGRLSRPDAVFVRSELQARSRRRTIAVIGASGVAVLACVLALRPRQNPAVGPAGPTAVATTKVLAPERQALPDGSIVELRSGSRIEADFSGGVRRVRLIQGEALFAVAKDRAHPFLVDAGSVEVRAVGTAFAVAFAPQNVEVLVTEGRVAVKRPTTPFPAFVAAGSRIVVATQSAETVMPASVPAPPDELKSRLAWTVPRIEFSDTGLAEAAAIFNRRNHLQLQVGDPAAGALRITGVFRDDDVEGFVSLLGTGLGVRAERLPGDKIVLFAPR